VETYLDAGVDPVTAAARGAAAALAARAEVKLAPASADAVETLVALGESRTDAERLVQAAAEKTPGADAGALVAAVIARLGR
jgi:Holliday junction resolvasome RuvABC DNA-binding subunit